MTDDALPPSSSDKPSDHSMAILVACATIVILAALGAGGYLLQQELLRMQSAKPEAPREVTQALSQLRAQLDAQRNDSATQMQALQQEITALKEQAKTQQQPDIQQTLAPVQEKLDAIAAQLEQPAPPPPVAAAPAAEAVPAPAAPTEEVATAPAGNALHDYLALRRAVEAGTPYAAELAKLIPQLPDTDGEAIATLQTYAEHGLQGQTVVPSTTSLTPWMESLNSKMKGLVSIRPSIENTPPDDDARGDVMAALDHIETSLLGAQ